MGWVSGTPTVPLGGPGEPPGGASGWIPPGPPSAWIPPTARQRPEALQRARIDSVLFLVSGVAYLILVALLVVATRLETLVSPGMATPPGLEDLIELVGLLGWLGYTLSGVILYFLPAQLGIPYRPALIARIHLLVGNLGVVGYSAAVLEGGPGSLAAVFLIVTSLSYLMFIVPLVLALILAAQEWWHGEL